MAKAKQSTSDCISAVADTGTPVGLPPDTQNIEPLDLVEARPVRTKLRTYAILLALYVRDLIINLE